MTTQTIGNLTIIRHTQTDGTISVYRGDHHLGMIYPALSFSAVPSDPGRDGVECGSEQAAIVYLTA